MNSEIENRGYSLRDLNRAYNMGLRSAIHILECAEVLSREGIRKLTEELKKQIAYYERET